MSFFRSVRDIQIRCNSMALPGSTVLTVDGMNGPQTRAQLKLVMDHLGVNKMEDIFDPSGINRVHWHWAASRYAVTWDTRKHYNGVFDHEGNEYDGGAPPQQQAVYSPYRAGVSHTLSANTGAIGLSIAAMHGAIPNWGKMTVNQGQFPVTWAAIDAMLEKTAFFCRFYNIYPSPWTTLSHAEVQGTLGIKQNNKWDIQVLPDEPTKILSGKAAGDILRKRMMEKFG